MPAAIRDQTIARAGDLRAARRLDRPGVTGWRDQPAGGTQMVSDGQGAACALNRPRTHRPRPGKRSRGALPVAAVADEAIDGDAFAAFNLCAARAGGRAAGRWPCPPVHLAAAAVPWPTPPS